MKTKVLFGSVLLLLLCIFSVSFANEGKVTFINGAQKAGVVSAKIYFGSSSNFCTVTGTVSHPAGTSAADKATQLAADISAQCVGATATANGGTVTVTQSGTNEISEIDITDGTNQRKTINPHGLDNDIKKASVSIDGFGTCPDGSAYLSLDDYGIVAIVSTFDKTGSQISDEIAAVLSSNPAIIADNVSIASIDFADGRGLLVFQNLPNDKSIITFDGGGDCGFSDVVAFGKDDDDLAIPTLSEWGVIILLLLVLAVGMVFLYQRQSSLVLAGVAVSQPTGAKPKIFDGKLFAKVFAIVLLIGAVGLVAAWLYFGQITSADPFGVFVSAAVVAYMVHLHILRKARDNM